MALKGLIVRQPWIGKILEGSKTWEMRATPWKHRGQIALIEKGSKTVVGVARMVEDRAPLSEAAMHAAIDKHGIPSDQIAQVVADGWTRPWVLAEIRRLPRPVPYEHPNGAVKTVNLDLKVERAIAAQLV